MKRWEGVETDQLLPERVIDTAEMSMGSGGHAARGRGKAATSGGRGGTQDSELPPEGVCPAAATPSGSNESRLVQPVHSSGADLHVTRSIFPQPPIKRSLPVSAVF